MNAITPLESIFEPSDATNKAQAEPTPAPAPQEVAEPVEPTEPEAAAPLATEEPAETPVAPEAAAPETGATPEPEPPATTPGGPAPQVPTKAKAQTGKAKDAPPASDDEDLPKDVKGLRAATKDERRKRQEMEKQFAEIQRVQTERDRQYQELDGAARTMWAQLQQYQQGKPQQPQPQVEPQQPPDPNVDPEGALAYRDALWAQALRARDAQAQQREYQRSVLHGQRVMRTQFQDYDQMEAVAAEAAQRDPELRQAIVNHPDPAGYAYEVGRNLVLRHYVAQAGGWENYIAQHAQAEAERRFAALQAEHVAQQPPAARPTTPTVPTHPNAPKAPPPQSLAGVTSAVPRNPNKAYAGPTPLEDILK